MTDTLKRHLISGVITFIANFGMALVIALSTLPADQAFTGAVIWGLINVGLRGGIKGLWETVTVSKS